MKTILSRMFFSMAFLLSVIGGYGQLTVTSGLTAAQYVDFLVGSGITYSNVVYTGDPAAIGKFITGTTPTNLGLTSGVIMSSGYVNGTGTQAIGSPVSNFVSTTFTNIYTDANLQSLIPSYTVEDATKIEFDFIPVSDTIRFRYVFGSEEYLEWVSSSFNDVFGFFISGPNPAGGNYSSHNIARIPNTTLPVTIDNINTGSYSQYYVNNEGLGGTTIVFDGFTTVLTAWAVVTPCVQYHIKLAIGDAGDQSYDSGVFLEANSFSSPTLNVSTTYVNDTTIGNFAMEAGCNDVTTCFSLSSTPATNFTVNYTILGTATNGVDYPTIPSSLTIPAGSDSVCITISPTMDNLAEGVETIMLVLQNQISCNTVSDTVEIMILDYEHVSTLMSPDTSICGDTVNIWALGTLGVPPYNYAWNNGLPSTTSHLVSPTTTTTYVVTVTDYCNHSTTNNVTITVGGSFVDAGPDQTICEGQSATLNAASDNSIVWNTGDTTLSITVSPPHDSTYVIIAGSGDCMSSDTVTVFVLPQPGISASVFPDRICEGKSAQLTATGADMFLWESNPFDATLNQTPGGLNNMLDITPSSTTTYNVTGTNVGGCFDTATVKITVVPAPVASFFTQPPYASSFNPTIQFFDNSQGNPVLWRWLLSDGSTYDIPEFTHTYPMDTWGEFPVLMYVENADGCSDSITQMITIKPDYTLYIPNAISPNGDGINDRFHISGLNIPIKDFSIRIYDRWGALMFSSSVPSFEWDGYVDGKVVPDAIYNYRLIFSDPTGNVHVRNGSITIIY
ncbi:MAG: choice-of-anchor L domain-containing protein [Bacteroidales bacterium]|jgi:gliding motility-associated-like protein|nr:choice-of-anchor L domain-containing protein [Bacteroidales bacterium]